MLTYWTRRYVLVLLCSLLLLAVVSGFWLRASTYEQIYNILEFRAEQLADVYGQSIEESVFTENLKKEEINRPRFSSHVNDVVQIADVAGKVWNIKKEKNPAADPSALYELSPLHQDVLAGNKIREQFQVAFSGTWLRVGVPINQEGTTVKALYISMPAKNVTPQIVRLYSSLALLTGIITVAGWLVLYFLSRRMTQPLREVAAAAQSIAEGKYDPVLPEQVKELELQQLVVSFRNMAVQLKQLEQLRTDLLAGVSHELRTPITSIRGMIQAVHHQVVSGKEADEFLQISLNEAKRLQQMVEDLLDFSSFESGATPIQKQAIDLSRLAEEVVLQLRASPEFFQIQFELNLPREPVWLEGDAGRLRQILLNLFNNSQKAAATFIKITFNLDGNQVWLDILDNGKGIDLKDQPYVFERFYRGISEQSKKHGLGLGLATSRLLARAHGGNLILLDACAEGTTFRLNLPKLIS